MLGFVCLARVDGMVCLLSLSLLGLLDWAYQARLAWLDLLDLLRRALIHFDLLRFGLFWDVPKQSTF